MPTPEEKRAARSRILRAIFGSVGSAESAPFPGIIPALATGALSGLKSTQDVRSPGVGFAAGLASGVLAPMNLQMELERHRAAVDRPETTKPKMFQMTDKNRMRHVVTVDPLTGAVLSDVNTNIQGPPSPFEQKGVQDAALTFAFAKNALNILDPIFDKFDNLPEPLAKLAGVKKGPFAMMSRVMFPQLKALEDNFVAFTAFSLGGKTLSGTEKETVTDAFLPNAFDNKQSRGIKRGVVRDYLNGRIDILQAANLLGPAGENARAVLKKVLDPSEIGIGEREKFIRLLMNKKNFTRIGASRAADAEGL